MKGCCTPIPSLPILVNGKKHGCIMSMPRKAIFGSGSLNMFKFISVKEFRFEVRWIGARRARYVYARSGIGIFLITSNIKFIFQQRNLPYAN